MKSLVFARVSPLSCPRTLFSLLMLALASLLLPAAAAQTVTFMGAAYTLGSGLTYPDGVAIDGSGNIFVACARGGIGATYQDGAVYELVAAGGYTTVNVLSLAPAIANPTIDPYGNVYVDPSAIAIDKNGNVYVTDRYNKAVFELTASSGYATVNALGSGWLSPNGVAVDKNGNVYIVDGVYSHEIKGIRAVNGSIPASPSIITLWSFDFDVTEGSPLAVAVDGNGHILTMVARTGNILDELFVNYGGFDIYSLEYLQSTGNVDPDQPLATDSNGDVFFLASDPNSGDPAGFQTLFEIQNVNGTIADYLGNLDLPLNPVAAFYEPSSLGVDGSGNLYVTGISYVNFSGIYEFNPLIYYSAYKLVPGGTNFGSADTASSGSPADVSPDVNRTARPSNVIRSASESNTSSAASSSIPLVFLFNHAATLGSTAVLTQGAPGLDFTDAGNDTCTPGSISAGTTCTLNVSFNPTLPGARYGAAVLYDGSGNVLATGYVQGAGVAPLVNFPPGRQSTLGSGLSSPAGVALDGFGNIYIGNSGKSQVLKGSFSAGTYSQTILPTSGLQAPGGVAVDGAGNTYIADYTGNAVYKETPLGTTYTQSTVASSLNAPTGVAVDANGNVYIVNSGSQQVFKETLSNGSYTQSSIGTGLVAPYGVAVDSSGSVYISDPGNTTVFKETFSAGSYTQSSIGSGLEEPEGLAMDAFGNIYISDAGLVEVLKETLSAGSYTQSVVSASGLTAPAGLAVDGSGNIYIADYLGNHVLKEDLADPPSLSFATKTKAGTTDTADGPLTVTVTNVGNAPLTFPTPSSGNNPSISGDFTFDSSGDGACPLVAAGSADGTLAAGATCFLSVSFTPTAIGALTGSLMLTDNAPNAAAPSYATQTIPLSGMGIQGPQTITFPAITAAQYALTQLALSAAATSGLTVTFTSTTPAICTVSGSMASLLTVGTCILHAAQAGNPSYTAAATVSQGFYVHPAQQTITFKTITGAWYALSQITLSATASSGLAVSFATTTPTVCSVAGNTVSLLIGGSCILQATQTGNTLYGAATPVTQVVAVHLAHQSITFTPITGTQYALSQLALSASSSSGLPVTLASATPTVCTLSGNTASLVIAGTCDIHATQAGNATYAAAPLLAYDIDVHPIIQTINFATVAVPVYPLTQVTLSATANSGLSVSFASVTPTICTVSGTTLSLLTAGNCYLHALQNGNPDYAAAPIVTQKVVVTPLSQTITFPTIGSQIVGANVTLSATANSGLTVSFASATTSVCSVSGTTATMLTAGSCVIHATQAGNSTYSAAPLVSQSFAVKAAS